MTNYTARNAARKNIAALTPMGRRLMLNIGEQSYTFFDDGVEAGSGIWHEVLTDESAGADELPKTRTGVANVIDKLVKDGLLNSDDNGDDGVWVSLTKSGAAVAVELASSAKSVSPAEQPTKRVVTSKTDGPMAVLANQIIERAASKKSDDVVPLPRTERGRNGTTKNGKTPAKKTGNPKTDKLVTVTPVDWAGQREGDDYDMPKSQLSSATNVRVAKTAAKKTAAQHPLAGAENAAKLAEALTVPAKKTAAKKTAAPAKKTAAKTASKKTAAAPKKSWATKGLMIVAARKSRVSGTLVWLVNAAAKDSTISPDAKSGMTWARRCVDHDHNDFQISRSAAWLGASDPTGWCPKCKSAAAKLAKKAAAPAKTATPAVAKKTAAKKTSAAKKTAAPKADQSVNEYEPSEKMGGPR